MLTRIFTFVLTFVASSQVGWTAPVSCFDKGALKKCPGLTQSCADLLHCAIQQGGEERCAITSANFDAIMSQYDCPKCFKAWEKMKDQNRLCLKALASPAPALPPSAAVPPGCAPNDLEFPAFTGLGIGCSLSLKNCPCKYEPCSSSNLPYGQYGGFAPKAGTIWAAMKTGQAIVAGPFAGKDEYKFCTAKICAKNQAEAVSCMGPEWK